MLECDCDCHDDNSAIVHFVPCCCGKCPFYGVPYIGLRQHIEESHKEAQARTKNKRKPRWKDIGRTHEVTYDD